jgi:hypothetical protein
LRDSAGRVIVALDARYLKDLTECEAEIATFANADLQRSVPPKATLGWLAELLAEASASRPEAVALSRAIRATNEVWG